MDLDAPPTTKAKPKGPQKMECNGVRCRIRAIAGITVGRPDVTSGKECSKCKQLTKVINMVTLVEQALEHDSSLRDMAASICRCKTNSIALADIHKLGPAAVNNDKVWEMNKTKRQRTGGFLRNSARYQAPEAQRLASRSLANTLARATDNQWSDPDGNLTVEVRKRLSRLAKVVCCGKCSTSAPETDSPSAEQPPAEQPNEESEDEDEEEYQPVCCQGCNFLKQAPTFLLPEGPDARKNTCRVCAQKANPKETEDGKLPCGACQVLYLVKNNKMESRIANSLKTPDATNDTADKVETTDVKKKKRVKAKKLSKSSDAPADKVEEMRIQQLLSNRKAGKSRDGAPSNTILSERLNDITNRAHETPQKETEVPLTTLKRKQSGPRPGKPDGTPKKTTRRTTHSQKRQRAPEEARDREPPAKRRLFEPEVEEPITQEAIIPKIGGIQLMYEHLYRLQHHLCISSDILEVADKLILKIFPKCDGYVIVNPLFPVALDNFQWIEDTTPATWFTETKHHRKYSMNARCMCITWYTGTFREEEDDKARGHWAVCCRFVVEAGEKKRIYFHYADSRAMDVDSRYAEERIKTTTLWRNDEHHESFWFRMDIPQQSHEKNMRGKDGGIWRTLVIYKIMDAFKKGKLDVTKEIRMTITNKKRTSAEIGKAGRHWILDGILQEALDTNHGAIQRLKIGSAEAMSNTAKENQRKKAKRKKKTVEAGKKTQGRRLAF